MIVFCNWCRTYVYEKELFASTALQITEIHTILNRYHYFSKTPLKVYFSIGRVKPIKT